MAGYIMVDLDGTLAFYESGNFDPMVVGPPIPVMVERVKGWLKDGYDVRIFTARVCPGQRTVGEILAIRKVIKAWCIEHLRRSLPITAYKDYGCVAIYDDRAVRVEHNTGRLIGDIASEATGVTEVRPNIAPEYKPKRVVGRKVVDG